MCAIVIEQMVGALDGEGVPYIRETPSTIIDINNIADYCWGVNWTEPIAGMSQLDNELPSGQFNQ
jgi:hypothetical protein